MAFLAPAAIALAKVAAVAAVTTATTKGVSSLLSPKSKDVPTTPGATQVPKPQVPKIEDAAAKAREDVKKRRSIISQTGGVTNITRGLATVPEANVGRKSLIGQ